MKIHLVTDPYRLCISFLSHLLILMLVISISQCPALMAQELRYELGARLRLFERQFELLKTPEERGVALAPLKDSVQKFFAMQLKNAAEDLDKARVAIYEPKESREQFARSVSLQLVCSSRLLDPGSQSLQCTIRPLYGAPDCSGLILNWQLCSCEASQRSEPVLSGSLPLANQFPIEFAIDVKQLPVGDYRLTAFASPPSDGQSAKDGTTEPQRVPLIERMVALAHNPEARIDQLLADIEQIVKNATEDPSSGDSTHFASLQGNARMLKKILANEALETDFPASRLLDFCEKGLEKLRQGLPVVGAKQVGEFWVVTGSNSGKKWLRVHAPEAAASGKPLPLVLALHGAGGSENMFFDSYGDGKIVRLAQQRQWLLVAPRAGFGYSGFQLDTLIEAIDQLYPVDRQAVFIVGHSMGAGGAIALTASAERKPTAVAALGGGRAVSQPELLKSVPFFVAAGSDVFGRPGAQALAESLRSAGGNASYRDYPNVEHLAIVQVALDDVFEFFDSHLTRAADNATSRTAGALSIDQLQLVGTHNSYHIAPDVVASKTISLFAPGQAQSLDNTQRPLTEQFDKLAVRHIELDLYLDPEGKLFRQPTSYVQAVRQKKEVPVFDPDGKMSQPGIKVLHSPDFDYRTTTYTLIDALSEVRRWSEANPKHVPIFVLLELKSDSFSPLTRPLKWTTPSMDALEQEILSVFPRERLLTPDVVRGTAATLRKAVEGRGWPSVESQRGKVAFLLDNEGAEKDLYLSQSPILQDRLLFVSVPREHPAAAWMKLNDAVGSFDQISDLVKAGFLVRTRADVGTVEARKNDAHRRDRAIASGAQLISTDYPEPDLRFSDYSLTLPLPEEPK